MAGKYAESTGVSPERSRAEIEAVLKRYGAGSFFYGWQERLAILGFQAHGRMIQFHLPMPDPRSQEFTTVVVRGAPRRRTEAQALAAWEQAVRQRWRALTLVVKAKLEAVEAGISDFETEFLGHIVLPSGRTVATEVKPLVAQAYQDGRMPQLLPFKTG